MHLNKRLKDSFNRFKKLFIPRNATVLLLTLNNYEEIINAKNKLTSTYDYIVIIEIIEYARDIQRFFETVRPMLRPDGRLIIVYENYLYAFIKSWFIPEKPSQPLRNWLSTTDIRSFLHLTQFEPIVWGPLLTFFNQLFLPFFPFTHLSEFLYFTARPKPATIKDRSVSIIIPARNEAGNISKLFETMPVIGTTTEIIFVEGGSKDNTRKEIQTCIRRFDKKFPFTFRLVDQGDGRGKAHAVNLGFQNAKNEILIILDADLSVQPADLQKFYLAIIRGDGEFINGSRLVYPLETGAMQLLNILGNKFFSLLFSWILGQPVKDTLCGTKTFFRSDYIKMKKLPLFGKYDPFGDFDLLTSAALLNLKIVDLPVRYHVRKYGRTNIKRFQNGWELLRYSIRIIWTIKMRF